MKTTAPTMLAGLAMLIAAPLGLAQPISLLQDNRSLTVAATGSENGASNVYFASESAPAGQQFNGDLVLTGLSPANTTRFRGVSQQFSQIEFPTSESLLVRGTMTSAFDTSGVGGEPGGAIDGFSDSVLDLTFDNETPMRIRLAGSFRDGGDNAEVTLTGLEGLDGFTPGVQTDPSGRISAVGVIPAGLTRVRAATTSTGDSATFNLSMVGTATNGVLAPLPAAVWPGLLLLGGMILKRRRPASAA